MSAGRWIYPLAGVGLIAWAARSEEKLRQDWDQNRGRRSRIPKGTVHIGRFNKLGDELVVFPGRSDWGEQGWFVGEQLNHPGREPSVTPKVFFRGDAGKEHALDSARTEDFWGYGDPKGRSARGRKYNKRVSKCISGKVRGEGWDERQAVAACLNMDRSKRLRSDGTYRSAKGRRADSGSEITHRYKVIRKQHGLPGFSEKVGTITLSSALSPGEVRAAIRKKVGPRWSIISHDERGRRARSKRPVRAFVEGVRSGYAYGLKDADDQDLLWYLVKDDGTKKGMDKAYREASNEAASLWYTFKKKPRLIYERIKKQGLAKKRTLPVWSRR